MGDKQGHAFRGNQYTAAQVAAMDRMQDRANRDQGHAVAAKHGVGYDPETGSFRQGPIPMSAESLAIRTGRATAELKGAAVPDLDHLKRENAIPARVSNVPTGGAGEFDRPVPGKVYNLTGFASGEKSIAKGNTWAESEVKTEGRKADPGSEFASITRPAPKVPLTANEKSVNAMLDYSRRYTGADRPDPAPKPEKTSGQRAYARRKERDQAMRDAGLVKVKGARGGTYWE
jgi:hypothetical protein